MARSATAEGIWADESQDLARGIAGGLLFGVPLLYTMEVWWLGGTTSPPRMLVILGVTLVPVTL
ncbi:MAG: TIGR02587 family membrane protein, partial [Actinobacteria bacterium]|nr:TIGR02587 family membrane protein [Actinomycetota bacterium]